MRWSRRDEMPRERGEEERHRKFRTSEVETRSKDRKSGSSSSPERYDGKISVDVD